MYRRYSCIREDTGKFTAGTHEVVEEVPITLNVNGRHAMTAMTSPDRLEDFIVGYLYTEQIVKGVDEIDSIRVEKDTVSVLTKNPFKLLGPKKIILSGCGGSSSFIDEKKLPRINSTLVVPPGAIMDAVKRTLTSELHRMTGGIHVVALVLRDGTLHTAEDIGRHNALDRVVGYALRNGIDLSQTFTVSSGRISSEMVRKCLIANIPIIVSRGATTSLAVEVARKTGLTVIGFARGGTMNIYANPERIEGAPGLTE
jgi:FdhD protein